MDTENFAMSGPVWDKYFARFKAWMIFSMVISVLLFCFIILCVRGSDNKDYNYLIYVFVIVVIISITEVLMTLFVKSRKRITSTSLLCYINGLVALSIFYALKQKIGGHASTIEEKAYGIMLIEVIVALMTCIGIYFANREIKMVIEKE